MEKCALVLVWMLSLNAIVAQQLESFDLSEEWLNKIEQLAPNKPSVQKNDKRHILIFSLHTGYQHWTIPHTEAVVKLIAEKSGAFTVDVSNDISKFERKNLEMYDALVLNNNCSQGEMRDLFWDKLKEDLTMTDAQRIRKAKKLEKNLLKYVKKGHGLVVMHGGIVMQNKSKAFGEMVGGSFDYHPKQQEIHVKLVDPDHPLVKGFEGEGFSHVDEPYFFNNAYFDYNFKPLLYLEVDQLVGMKEQPADKIKYISWVKNHGKGRVFFSSPSHNAQSMENPHLLQFFLDGLQYATGDLPCDATPRGKM